jgi:hypothetical protein
MIADDQEPKVMLERIARFQARVARLRHTQTNPANHRAAVCGLLAGVDRMRLELREYLSPHPADAAAV